MEKRGEKFLENVEYYNSKLIPPALVMLLGIIIFELFLHVENEMVLFWVHFADYAVITVFVIDLIFLARKAKSTRYFFKNYWLDILAVFPFVLMFKALEFIRALRAAEEGVVVGQAIFHETVEAGKAAAKAERFTKLGRSIRIMARSARFATKTGFLTRFKRKRKEMLRD
ncbi:hypothetical protein HYX11_01615 [Candidatus Woesearchaeota archaeon]|nr:hypothetical protein [Candidatus Woesearchaeota archaeon]